MMTKLRLYLLLTIFTICCQASATTFGSYMSAVSDPLFSKTEPKDEPTNDAELLNSAQGSLHFVENKGQWNGKELFRAEGFAATIQIMKQGFMLSQLDAKAVKALSDYDMEVEAAHAKGLEAPAKSITVQQHAWMVEFVGMSSEAKVESVTADPTTYNYFIGNDQTKWASSVKSFQEVWYKNIYANIDARLYAGNSVSMEYDIIAKPGADLSKIQLRYTGLNGVKVRDGKLVITTIFGETSYAAPVAYQVVGGKRTTVECAYVLSGEGVVSFKVGAYDKTQTLVIDPIALRWATYLSTASGSGNNHHHGIEVDAAGSIYSTGKTDATNFPTTTGVISTTYTGSNTRGFVTKLNQPATVNGAGSYAFCTYFGGTNGTDNPYAIKMDAAGNLYICGVTSSSNFTRTTGSYSGYKAKNDAFITKINNTGTSILYSTLLGGTQDDEADFIYVNTAGEVYVVGSTANGGFPTTAGAHQTTYGGGSTDGYFAKLSADGSTLLYSTFYGGSNSDVFTCVRPAGTSDVVITGTTLSTSGIATTGAFKTTYVGSGNGVVVKFSTAGVRQWGTYINAASGKGVQLLSNQVDGDGNIYFGGLTSGAATSSITAGTYQTTYGGGSADLYLGKLNSTGTTLLAGTYIGGSGNEINFMGVNIDTYGDVYGLGYTESTNIPATTGAMQTSNYGNEDAIFLKMSADYTSMKYLSYWGGTADETDPIGFDGIKFSNCRAYTALTVFSQDAPMTKNAFKTPKTSGTSVCEPAVAVWSNPPDLTGDAISGNETLCKGATPTTITGTAATYLLSDISRNGTISAQNSPGGITYSWQKSTDMTNWTAISGATGVSLTAAQIGALTQTTYFQRIISGDFCQGAVSTTVTKTVSDPSVTFTNTPVTCNGAGNGILVANPSNGTALYTYVWSTGATSQTISNLTPGNYSVTVKDAQNCVSSAAFTATVTQPAVLTASAIATAATCNGSSTGTVDLTVAGGNAPYTYVWSNGATTQDLTGVGAGTYKVTVTDAKNCTATSASVTVTQPAALTVGLVAINTCAGGTNGGVTSFASGGTAPYTYVWGNSGTGSTSVSTRTNSYIGGLAAGTYSVTVKDSKNCTATASAVVTNVTVTVVPSHDTTICAGGSAQLVASGADLYSWSPINGLTDSAISNPIASPTVTTTYTVTGYKFTSNLVYNGNFDLGNVGINSAYGYIAAGGSLVPEGLFAVDTNAHNYHNNFWGHDRTTGHSNFMIVNGAPDSNTVIWTQTVHNIMPNTKYYFTTWASSLNTITNYANLAFSINGILMPPVISSPADTNHWVQFYSVWNSGSSTDAVISIVNQNTIRQGNDFGLDDISFTTVCSDQATVKVTVNPKPTASAGADKTICAGTSTTLTATGGGTYAWSNGATTATTTVTPTDSSTTYKVTVTSALGCSATDSVKVNKFSTNPIAVSAVKTDVLCFGGNTGTATTTVTGGTAPYTYVWSNGATTANLTGVVAGTYSVTVKDANNCTVTSGATVVIGQPTALNSTFTYTGVSCFGATDGVATVAGTGGTSPYTYRWSTGATTATITGRAAGNYAVTITDAKGCTKVDTGRITQPGLLTLGATATPVTCNGASTGAIDLTVSGGTSPFTYNWSTGAHTEDISGLAVGTYNVTVIDAHNCSATVAIAVSQPATLTVSATGAQAPKCNGASNGSINSTVVGGTAPYTYIWSNGATTANLTGIPAGTYNVTVTDARGCSASTSNTTTNVTQPNTLTVSATGAIPPSCNGGNNGSINSTVAGGTAPYTYKWNTGATTANLTGVTAGTYNVTVTDANGCTAATSNTVSNVPQPTVLSVSTAGAIPPSCNGGTNGSINSTVSGGTAPYTYLWSNGATTANLTNVAAGTYNVTVTDAKGCTSATSNTTTNVTQPTVLAVSTSGAIPPSCNGGNNGSISSTVTGGTAPYTYLWSTGATTAGLTGIAAGTYNVTVTDAKGCTASTSNTVSNVSQPSALTSSISITGVSCFGATNGAATVTAGGGTSPYTYLWSTGATTATITGRLAGNYAVTITDAKGCTKLDTARITQPGALTLSANVTPISCNGGNDGLINLSVVGGTGPYTYLWSTGSILQNVLGLAVGTYSVSVVDAHSCSATVSIQVTQPALLTVAMSGVNPTCNGAATGSVTAVPAGGTAPYTYAWSNGATTSTISNVVAGTYTVTITDSKGCKVTGSRTLTQPAALDATFVVTNINCAGQSNGTITTTVTGGVSPYTYLWNNGATTANRTGLAAGSYDVKITDANGCFIRDTVGVLATDTIKINVDTVINVACYGGSTGAIDISVTGGSPACVPTAVTPSADCSNCTQSISGNVNVTVSVGQKICVLAGTTFTGNLNIDGGQVVVCGALNPSNITINGGNLTVIGTANLPTLNVAAGASVTNYGTINVATTANINGTLSNYGSLTGNADLNVNSTGSLINGGSLAIRGALNNVNLVTNNGLLNVSANLNNNSGGTFTNNCTVNGSGNFNNNGIFINNGVLKVALTSNLSAGSTLNAGPLSQYVSTNLFLNGLITGSGNGASVKANGLVIINLGGLINGTLRLCLPLGISINNGGIALSVLQNCNGGGSSSDTTAVGYSYTYTWSNGKTTQDINGLTAGTYTVTVTDANGCTAVKTITVTQPTQLTATYTYTRPTCFGSTNGTVTIAAAGGVSPYTYRWSTGATTATITGRAAGNYAVTITDANGCTKIDTARLTQPSLLTLGANPTPATCNGASTGSIDLTVTGGTAPFTYNWSTGAHTEDISGLATGTYTVSVIDANNCSATVSTAISQPATLTVSATGSVPPSCNGASNGSINSTVVGGTAPYTYLWSNGATTANLTGIPAGTYNVTVTDARGCSASTSNTTSNVTQPAVLTVSATGAVPPSCNGNSNGSINSTVTGGTAPFTYLWSNGATTANLTGIPAGTYNVTVTDAKGCTASTTNTTTNVPQPAILNVTATGATSPSCFGTSTGSINSTVTGGTAPFTYLWSNGATTANLTNIPAGTYNVTVTDAKGCTSSTSNTTINVTQPTVLAVSATGAVQPSCFGTATGSINSTVTGGTAPYTYVWSNGATTANLTNITAGTYNVTVTDAKGCTASSTNTVQNVTQPAALTSTISFNSTISCFGATDGTATVTAGGGTSPYTYRWSTGATTATITGRAAGNYFVTVTDAKGCTKIDTARITQPGLLTLGANVTPATCNGTSTGAIDLTVTGGTPAFTYNWSTGAHTEDITGLAAGTYTVTVIDAHNCSATVSIAVTQPNVLTVSATNSVSPACNGASTGSINSTVVGGTAAYTYLWSNGATTANLTGIPAGTYNVTVTDANGCTAATSNTTTNVTQPSAITPVLTAVNPGCNGANNGSISAAVTGGTGTYTYLWSNGATTSSITGLGIGTFSVTVTDANGCTGTASKSLTQPGSLAVSLTVSATPLCNGAVNGSVTSTVTGGTAPFTYLWSNGATTANLSGIGAGSYNVTVSDANHCQATAVNSISVTQPTVVTSTITINARPSCFGSTNGSATVAGGGGTSPYTYRWSTGATTATITGRAAGNYVVTITDANGCTKIDTARITQPGLLTLGANVTPATCNGFSTGAIDLTVTGGTPAFTYTWSTGATTEDINGLAAGTYSVTVVDSKSCSATVAIAVTEPATLALGLTATNTTCNAGANGTVSTTVTGGNIPYAYLWSNGATTANITGVTAGTYSVTVTDYKGCTATGSKTVTQPNAIVATLTATNPACNGNSNGSITTSVIGGTGAYTYLWSNGATTANLTGLAIGTYTVTVTDASGCTGTATKTLTQPATLSISATGSVPVLCYGASTGSVTSTATGGTAPFTYIWSNGATTANLANIPSGTYNVTVTDANGCSASTSNTTTTVPQPTVLTSTITINNRPSCFGSTNGSATVAGGGGVAPYTYRWSTGATTATITGRAAGNYAVTITDANGCTKLDTARITQPGLLTLGANVTPATCNGFSTGAIDLTVTGGTPAFVYTWSTGATTEDISGLAAGTYTVTVVDSKSCSATVAIAVTEPATLALALTASNPACNGGATGSITTNPTGGNIPYTYLWSNGATTQNITGVAAGTYTVTVTDLKGCSVTGTKTLTDIPALSVSITSVNPACFGNANGSVTAVVNGGAGTYAYHWANNATTASLTGLTIGTYSVTVTDANGCSGTATATLTQPAVLAVALTGTSANCYGSTSGSSTTTVTGGTAPYTYAWSNGQTTDTLGNVASGTYTLTVTDAHLCTATGSVTITQPAAPLATSININSSPTCFGSTNGSATVTATGGTSPYTYRWSTNATTTSITGRAAGTYIVTVTDSRGCTKVDTARITQPGLLTLGANVTPVTCYGTSTGAIDLTVTGGTPSFTYTWSTGATSQDVSGLAVGTYTVSVVDAHNCSATVSIAVDQPAVLALNLTATDPACNGSQTGNITSVVTGGNIPYTYLWSNGATTSGLTAVAAGTYTVTVTDNKGCSITASKTLTDKPSVSVTLTSTNPGCNGAGNGSITTAVTGGTGTFTYLWSTGATTANLTNLAIGTYSVTVTDANGCTSTKSATLTQPGTLAITATGNSVNCFSTATGSATTTVTGGTAPFTYLWSNGQTTANLATAIAGTYTVTVTDANHCQATTSVAVTQPTAALGTSININSSPTCFGSTNGSATVTATGGTSPYTYRWSTNATTATITGRAAGTYYVTVTDARGCTKVDTARITQPGLLTLGANVTPVACYGTSTGAIDLTVTGGTPSFTYTWSTGATTEDVSGLVVGTYSVTVVDAHNCSATVAIAVDQPQPLTASGVVTAANCNGNSNGGVVFTVTGGNIPYTYTWSNGQTTKDLTAVAAGIYIVHVVDNKGCTINDTFVVSQPNALVATATTTNVSCNGLSNGAISLSVAGGTAPYTYAWSTAATTSSISGLAIGTYNVTVTDAHNCTTTTSATVTQPLTLSAAATATSALCFGDTSGTVTLTVVGGTTPYNYAWSNGATTANPGQLQAGTYTVTITDAHNCSTTASVTVNTATALTSTITSINAICNGEANGSLTVVAGGGTAPYTYLWSNGQTTATATGLAAANYSVTITDAHGCTKVDSKTVGQPQHIAITGTITEAACNNSATGAITITAVGGNTGGYTYLWSNGATTQNITNITAGTYKVTATDTRGCKDSATFNVSEASALVTSTTTVNTSCFGSTNGSAAVTVSGGTAPYTYRWSTNATTATITGRAAGLYTVTVTDAHGCSKIDTARITQPGLLTLGANVTPANCYGESNGAIDLSVTGGTPAFTYNWSTSAHTEDISGLAAGTYNVTVNDAHNCSATVAIAVGQPNPLASTGVISATNCNGDSTGGVVLSATGGNVPYTYTWSNGQITKDLTLVPAGTYTVHVVDIKGCSINDTFTVGQPLALTATIATTQPLCNSAANGSATATAAGGTAPYNYAWSNGATTATATGLAAGTYTVTVTDAHGCVSTAFSTVVAQPAVLVTTTTATATNCNGSSDGSLAAGTTGGTAPYTYLWSNGQTSATATGLAAGNYTVTATDANGCSTTATGTVDQPTAITQSATIINIPCFGDATGGIDLTVNGGTPGYTYQWSWNSRPFATTQDVSGIPANTYDVVVTDTHGCTSTGQYTITSNRGLTIVVTTTDAGCNGDTTGSASVTVTGGTGTYHYFWPNGDTTASSSGYGAGAYTVSVQDSLGCSKFEIFTINQPASLVASATATDVLCNGAATGAVSATATGGTAPYTYAWSNGATTQDITNLTVGSYTVTITDAHGCNDIASANIAQPNPYDILKTVTGVRCNGGSNGSIKLIVSGNTAPYTYAWSNGTTSQNATALTAGTYVFTITDANGCAKVDSATITQPDSLLATTVVTNVACNGGSTGAIVTTVSGGTTPYHFFWTRGTQTYMTQNLSNIPAGTYVLDLGDAGDCHYITSVTVTEPTVLVAQATSQSAGCNGSSTGAVTTAVSGGVAPYTYTWSNGATTADLTNQVAGTYTVTVTDANGCSITSSATVNQPTGLQLTITGTPVSCFGGFDGAVATTVTGGSAPYVYHWSNSNTNTNPSQSGLRPGMYALTVTDANGCSRVDSARVSQPAPLTLGAVPTPVNCSGSANGSIDLTTDGPFPPFTYIWSNGGTTEDINGLAAGTYSVTVMNTNNCSATVSILVNQTSPITLSGNITQQCGTVANAAVGLSVVGGTSPYTYAWSNNDTVQNLANVIAGNYTVTVSDLNHCTATNTFEVTQSVSCGERNFRLRVKLEGPFDASTNQMTTNLNQLNVIPLTQPYSAAPLFYTGTESVTAMPSDITDWVLVSFRTGITPATTVYTMAGLMDRDGYVRAVSGDSIISFTAGGNSSLYIVVEHRNHMGIMSATAIPGAFTRPNTPMTDFTRMQSYQVGNPLTSGQKVVGTDAGGDIYAMHSGDGDCNFDINSNDFVPLVTDFNRFNVYLPGDFNMDGDCNSNDIPFWVRNFNLFSGVQH